MFFLGYQAQENNDQWMDSTNYQKISHLKNKISEKFKEHESANHLAIIPNLHNTNPSNWLLSKEATNYGLEIATKVSFFLLY